MDIADHDAVLGLQDGLDAVIHLAAQAGVRYSLEQPFAYAAANLTGHLSILELVRHSAGIKHLIYASSSSVYGTGTTMPYSESARADRPSSLYGATKRADELMSHSYSHLFGPWGRPDMAYFGFAEAIMAGKPVTLYDQGRLKRDFTYIDDIVAGILGVLDVPPEDAAPHRLFNIGNNKPEYVTDLLRLLENALGRKAIVTDMAKPEADPVETWADVSALHALCGYAPRTPLAEGIPKFVEWYLGWRAAGMRGLPT
jgi:UDP-glucuronate 4-epimerase